MPQRPSRPCSGRGPRSRSCPNLLKGNERYCAECEPWVKKETRKYDKARDQAPGRKFLHSSVWRRIRAAKLALNPLCQRCEAKGLIVPAVLVHHCDENQQNNHENNLKSVCGSCHELIHRKDRYGRNKP